MKVRVVGPPTAADIKVFLIDVEVWIDFRIPEIGVLPDDDDAAVTTLGVPQRDAATTVLRGTSADGTEYEVRAYDVMGKAMRHPAISSLQRLRAIERRMLELADAYRDET